MPLIQHLFRGLRKLVTSWYAVDRVRIAPTTGRLLQIRVGDSIVLCDSQYVVNQRRVDASIVGHQLTYSLKSADGDAELRVCQDVSTHAVGGELIIGNDRQIVFDGDIVVVTTQS